MEAKKNSLMQEFGKHARKLAATGLLAASAMSLGGCMVTTGGMGYVTSPYAAGGQYVNPTYGHNVGSNMQRGYAITYSPPRAPWANDPGFRNEVSIQLQLANNDVRRAQSTYQTGMANCSSRFASSTSRNSDYMARQRNRGGMDWMDYMNSGARINSTNANYNQCRVNVQTRFETTVLREQQSFNRTVDNLNRKYARQYGVKW